MALDDNKTGIFWWLASMSDYNLMLTIITTKPRGVNM